MDCKHVRCTQVACREPSGAIWHAGWQSSSPPSSPGCALMPRAASSCCALVCLRTALVALFSPSTLNTCHCIVAIASGRSISVLCLQAKRSGVRCCTCIQAATWQHRTCSAREAASVCHVCLSVILSSQHHALAAAYMTGAVTRNASVEAACICLLVYPPTGSNSRAKSCNEYRIKLRCPLL